MEKTAHSGNAHAFAASVLIPTVKVRPVGADDILEFAAAGAAPAGAKAAARAPGRTAGVTGRPGGDAGRRGPGGAPGDGVSGPFPATAGRGRPGLSAVIVAAALTAACGGPAATLHDVLDEAEERVDRVLAALEDTEDEMLEATGTELPPCPAEYQPPPLWTGPPPYEDQVERPAELGDAAEESGLVAMQQRRCRDNSRSLARIRTDREAAKLRLEDFAGFAEAVRDFIDDDMTDEDVDALSAEVEAVAAARPEEADTLQLRYQRLMERMVELSPLVREMALRANRPGAELMPGRLPASDEPEEAVREQVGGWAAIIEGHAEALAFVTMRNDYRRRIYEGPDTEDPDEAAGGWTPLTGVWSGEYGSGRYFSSPERVEITFQPDGATSRYPGPNCSASLELTSTSGASGRVTQYRETLTTGQRRCLDNGIVTLDRTGEDTIRFGWRGPTGDYAGNLTRQ